MPARENTLKNPDRCVHVCIVVVNVRARCVCYRSGVNSPGTEDGTRNSGLKKSFKHIIHYEANGIG